MPRGIKEGKGKKIDKGGDVGSLLPSLQANAKFISAGVFVGLAVLVAIIFKSLGGVLKPFFIALFLSYLLYPAVGFLVRHKIPKVLAYLIVFCLIFFVFYALGALIYSNVNDFREKLPYYQHQFQDLFGKLSDLAQKYGILGRLGLEGGMPLDGFSLLDYVTPEKLTAYIGSSLGSFFGLLGNIVVIIFFMIFIIVEAGRFPARVRWAYGEEKSDEIFKIVTDINKSVMRYLWVKTVISFVTGLGFAIVLGVFNVEFFILWGVMAFLLNYIPYIGSYIATILPSLVVVIQYMDDPLIIVIVIFLLFLIQNVMGSYLEPIVMGRGLDLSPLVVLISLAFWGWLWGVVGMFLSVPITASIKIVMEHFEGTRVIARLISDVKTEPVRVEKRGGGFLSFLRKRG